MNKTTVALVFGGKSGEHEVSLRSAASVIKALDRDKYRVVPIGITKKGQWRSHPEFLEDEFSRILEAGSPVFLPAEPGMSRLIQLSTEGATVGNQVHVDVVFPVLHGTYGEDGTIQGLLEMADLPYVGAGVLGSAAGMDKDVMKRLLHQAGVPQVGFHVFLERQWTSEPEVIRQQVGDRVGYPCFVKPANLGSSVGISKVKSPAELDAAIDLASQFDRKVIVEEGVDAREIECSVLGNEDPVASLPGEIIPSREFYDYAAKYISDDSRLLIPAPLSEMQTRRIQELATTTFLITECCGMARVDFFLERKSGNILVNEINSIPGFTSISMYPKLWEASGLSYPVLIDRLIQLALERHLNKRSKKTSYD